MAKNTECVIYSFHKITLFICVIFGYEVHKIM